MSLLDFIHQRQPAWKRLGEILNHLERRGPRRTPAGEIQELLHLYREVSADLARLRAQNGDPADIAALNRLVTRAHGQIYRGAARGQLGLVRFFVQTWPRLFRATWRYSFASFVICAIVYGIAWSTVQRSPEVVTDIMGGGEEVFWGEKTAEDIRSRFRSTPAPLLSSFVTTNNIRVAFMAFALGITFGIGTVYVLVVNATMLGGFAGAFAASGIEREFWITVLPHGALELSAIVVAGGSGLLLGDALWRPGNRTRRRALREGAVEAMQLAVGLVPAFIVAGAIEGFVTPSEALRQDVKLAIGILAAVAFWLYGLVGGWNLARTEPTSSQRPTGAG